MKVLVTGAAGFLGARLVRRILGQGGEVDAVDVISRSAAWRLGGLRERLNYHWAAVQDLRELNADRVIHAAAIADAPLAFTSPLFTANQNALSVIALLEAALHCPRVRRVLIVSSEAVYGRSERVPIPEDAPLNPSNVYGASKAAEELFGLAYRNAHGLPVTIVRPSTMFGEEMRRDQVLPIFLSEARGHQPLTIHGNGAQSRDFNYVENVVDGILMALLEERAEGGVFNLAGGHEVSMRDLAQRCVAVTGSSSPIRFVSQRGGEQGVRLVLDDARARSLLGYRPAVSFDDGLKRTAEWLALADGGSLEAPPETGDSAQSHDARGSAHVASTG